MSASARMFSRLCRCGFEDALSGELIRRLSVYPKIHAMFDSLPPKLVALSTGHPPQAFAFEADNMLDVAQIYERLRASTFTSMGNRESVLNEYKSFMGKIAGMLQSTLVITAAPERTKADVSLPLVDVPPAPPLRLAEGQMLVVLGERTHFGVVDTTGRRIMRTLAGGDCELAFDAFSQVVLPWFSVASGWDEALQREVQAMRDLGSRVRELSDGARSLAAPSESGLQALSEAARMIVDTASQQPTILPIALKAGAVIQVRLDKAIALLREMAASGEVARTGPQLEAMMEAVCAAIGRLQPDALASEALRSSGAMGARYYAAGQQLAVRIGGMWLEAAVVGADSGGAHHLRLESDGLLTSTVLHPWNHALRELPSSAFQELREWHIASLRAQHSHTVDSLSGQSFDTLSQMESVSIEADNLGWTPSTSMSNTDDLPFAHVVDASSLSAWLRVRHEGLVTGRECTVPSAVLLTSGPAGGKTTLLRQIILFSLDGELVPILIRVEQLQSWLLQDPDAFASSWNWVDTYVRAQYGAGEPIYRMLRQALVARRALILLDGLDKGGLCRGELEAHIADVLSRQGHVLLVTSRPAGVDAERFADFHRLRLSPLTDRQQEDSIIKRLGIEGAAALLPYVRERMPRDTETGSRVTANPLMLSMVASVFELRRGLEMPRTVSELYTTASDAMLARGGEYTADLRGLLQRIFFEAHVAQRRIIEDQQLDEAALGLEQPELLAAIRHRAADEAPFDPYDGRAEMGHFVEMVAGKHAGKRGVISTDDRSDNPYKVTFVDGAQTSWLKPDELMTSGLYESSFLVWKMAACATEVREACSQLQLSTALDEVRRRIKSDQLPLLSLLQVEPLQVQSSHLSFQEYYTALAICDDTTQLSGSPPWQWPAWWWNTLSFGSEMGLAFSRGLLRAAGVGGSALDLCGKLGGDRATVLRVVALFMTVLTQVNVGYNHLSEDAAMDIVRIARRLDRLTMLGLAKSSIGRTGAHEIAKYVQGSAVLTSLDLEDNQIGPEGGRVIASALGANAALAELNISWNQLDAQAGTAIAGALSAQTTMTSLDVGFNHLTEEAALSIVRVEKNRNKLTKLGLAASSIGSAGAQEIATYLKRAGVLTSLDLCGNELGPQGGLAIAAVLKEDRGALTSLDLSCNKLGPEVGEAIAAALTVNMILTSLNLKDGRSRPHGRQHDH